MPAEQVSRSAGDGRQEYIDLRDTGDAGAGLKKLAKAAGLRKLRCALKDVQPLTGYIRGGVTLLEPGAEPGVSTETATLFDNDPA